MTENAENAGKAENNKNVRRKYCNIKSCEYNRGTSENIRMFR